MRLGVLVRLWRLGFRLVPRLGFRLVPRLGFRLVPRLDLIHWPLLFRGLVWDEWDFRGVLDFRVVLFGIGSFTDSHRQKKIMPLVRCTRLANFTALIPACSFKVRS